MDELEEFSRISRANQNREYVKEFCRTDIHMDKEWFTVEFVFDNAKLENINPEQFFIGKCRRMLSIFRVEELDNNIFMRFICLDKVTGKDKKYKLEISRKYASITIDDEPKDIPSYLKSSQFKTTEEYGK